MNNRSVDLKVEWKNKEKVQAFFDSFLTSGFAINSDEFDEEFLEFIENEENRNNFIQLAKDSNFKFKIDIVVLPFTHIVTENGELKVDGFNDRGENDIATGIFAGIKTKNGNFDMDSNALDFARDLLEDIDSSSVVFDLTAMIL